VGNLLVERRNLRVHGVEQGGHPILPCLGTGALAAIALIIQFVLDHWEVVFTASA
jgi:hypothetical protein